MWFGSIEVGETFGLALAWCYADCNRSGELSVSDFGCARNGFVVSYLRYMDCNGDGVLTVAEFGCFQTWFVADLGTSCTP